MQHSRLYSRQPRGVRFPLDWRNHLLILIQGSVKSSSSIHLKKGLIWRPQFLGEGGGSVLPLESFPGTHVVCLSLRLLRSFFSSSPTVGFPVRPGEGRSCPFALPTSVLLFF